MRAAVISNGDITSLEYFRPVFSKYDMLISADGASNKLHQIDIVPDYILGDLDSIDTNVVEYFKDKSVEFIKFNPEKDFSDTHICVDFLIEKGYSEIDLYGAFGGRWDHTIANFGLMYYAYKKNIKLSLIDRYDNAKIYGEGSYISKKKANQCFSIFAVFEDAIVSLEGVKYPLKEYPLTRGESIGLSNEYIEDCKVSIKKGSAIIIESLSERL